MATPSVAASPGGREPRPEIVVLKRTVLSPAGVRTPIMQAGEVESAEAVVFVHGNPGSTADWTRLMQRVAPFCRAIAMDMPGFGQADKPQDFDYTVDGYRTHLNALLDALSVQRVHLVLHDFGGAWGLAWAARHPQRLASVTLINIGIMPGYRWHLLARIWRTPLLGELFMAMTNRSGLRFSTRFGNPRDFPDAYFEEMFRNFDAGTRRAVLRLYRNTSDVDAISQSWAATLTPLHLPALVIWGAHDPYVPVKFAEMQRQYFDVDRVVRLEGSGHWPMVDDPEAVGDALLSFLMEHRLGNRGAEVTAAA